MKKSQTKDRLCLRKPLRSVLLASFERVFNTAEESDESTPDLRLAHKGLSDSLPSSDDTRRMNAYLLEVERRKGEAIRMVRNRINHL